MAKWPLARDEKVTLNHLAVFCFMFFCWLKGGEWWGILSGMVGSLEVHTKHDFPTLQLCRFRTHHFQREKCWAISRFTQFSKLTHVAVDCNQLRFSNLYHSLLQVVVSINLFYSHRYLGKSSNVPSIFPRGWNRHLVVGIFPNKVIPGRLGEGFLAGISNANESQVVGSSFAPANLDDSNKEKLCNYVQKRAWRQEGAKGRKAVVDICSVVPHNIRKYHNVSTIYS